MDKFTLDMLEKMSQYPRIDPTAPYHPLAANENDPEHIREMRVSSYKELLQKGMISLNSQGDITLTIKGRAKAEKWKFIIETKKRADRAFWLSIANTIGIIATAITAMLK